MSVGFPYRFGERGPELFMPGADGQISTNGKLRMLEDGSFVPSAAKIASSRGKSGATYTRGDTHYMNHWSIHGTNDPARVQEQVESIFSDLMRRAESDQRGLLSD